MRDCLLQEAIKDIDHLIESKILLEFRFKELVRQTVRISKNRSRNCILRDKKADVRTLTWQYHVNCDEHYSSNAGWDVTVQIDPSKMKESDIGDIAKWHVNCKCTCPAWTYWGSDVLSSPRRSNYRIPPPSSNDQLPKRNLKYKDGSPWTGSLLCKHVLAIATRLESVWKSGKTRIDRRIKEVMKGDDKEKRKDRDKGKEKDRDKDKEKDKGRDNDKEKGNDKDKEKGEE